MIGCAALIVLFVGVVPLMLLMANDSTLVYDGYATRRAEARMLRFA